MHTYITLKYSMYCLVYKTKNIFLYVLHVLYSNRYIYVCVCIYNIYDTELYTRLACIAVFHIVLQCSVL